MSTRQASRVGSEPAAAKGVSRKPVSAVYHTEWGDGAVTVRDGLLAAVDLPGDGRPALGEPLGEHTHPEDRAALDRWVDELESYFRGERLSWTVEEVPLDGLGVPEFARKVYEALLGVPAAGTVSYGGLAYMAGYPRAARAVGTAMATNPVPIVVPCHRVIKSDGSYGNYGNDPAMKVRLLQHERLYAAREARSL